MRGILVAFIAAFLAATLLFAPKPASALPAASTMVEGQANAGLVHQARRWYRRGYARPYRYRRGYGYYGRPYYGRPYYRRGWGYPYWRRPGVNIWLGY